MPRSSWSRAVAAALLLLLGCGRDRRPDVLLIVLDTVRADHLSVYGYERRTSPALEALARDGVLYRRAIAPGTWSVPSHASLFTGVLPSVHGANRAGDKMSSPIYALSRQAPTLTQRMREANYRTRAFVGNHGYLDPVFGFARDFDRYDREHMRPAGRLAERTIDWLRRRRGRSVYLFINIMDAHAPYEPQPPYDRMFPGRLDRPVERNPWRAALLSKHLPSPEEMEHYRSQYDGEIRYIDDRLAEIFAALKELGRYDNALIVVTADHGESFGEHGTLGHGGFPYDDQVHVPLIVKYPGNSRRGVVDEPVSLIDVAPTILAQLGLPPLGPGQTPLWEHRDLVVSEQIAGDSVERAAYDASGHVLTETVGPNGARDLRLYDLRTDPGEEHPLDPQADPAGRRLDAGLRALLAGLPHLPRGELVHPESDRKLQRRLRALGYVE
jgi:arylsulfatase A-like enzyme